jgi:RND family efflux transporter MFP subunit
MDCFKQSQHRNKTLVGIAALLLLVSCEQESRSAAPPEAPPPQVSVATPLQQPVTDWDEFTGRLQAVESVEVRPRVSGYLQSVNFREGTFVEKGDLLYVIDTRPYQAAVDQARAELSRAVASLDLAKINLARAERLFKTNVISEEDLDLRQNQQRVSVADVEAARAALAAAELNLEFTHVKAPISGRISHTRVTPGNLISGGESESTLLTTIVSVDPIHVSFTADEQSVLRYLRLDMSGTRKSSREAANPVLLRLADEETYAREGRMDFVDNQIDTATGTMRGRAIVDNPDRLLIPGMFIDVRLLGRGPYDALLIPDTALGLDQTIQFVFVLDENDVAQRRQVRTGRLHGRLRVIEEGLEADDRVVINGIQRIRPGVKVAPEMTTIDPPATPASQAR